MHLSRRVAAPIAGAFLALSVLVAPAAAVTRPAAQPEPTSAICTALFSASVNLPDNPFITQIWSSLLSFFDCNQNTI